MSWLDVISGRLAIPEDRIRNYANATTGGIPVPADRIRDLLTGSGGIPVTTLPRLILPTSPASGGAPDPVKNPTATDPVMQALLQQLEYSKQAPASGGSSGVNRVQVLPGGGGGGNSTGLLVLLALVGVGLVVWFMFRKGKKKGGVQHVSDD